MRKRRESNPQSNYAQLFSRQYPRPFGPLPYSLVAWWDLNPHIHHPQWCPSTNWGTYHIFKSKYPPRLRLIVDSATYDLSLLLYKVTICFLISKYLCKFFLKWSKSTTLDCSPWWNRTTILRIKIWCNQPLYQGGELFYHDVNEQKKKPWTLLVQGSTSKNY